MRFVLSVCLALSLAPCLIWAGTPTHIRIKVGGETKLHIGQIAVLQLGSGHPYSVTLEGDAVAPIQAPGSERMHSYRAIRAGEATLLITPTDRKQGECLDCAVHHCFLTVVP